MASPVFRFCIHRSDRGDEKAVVLDDVADILEAAIAAHWRDASRLRRVREPKEIVAEALEAAFLALDDLARDRTLRL